MTLSQGAPGTSQCASGIVRVTGVARPDSLTAFATAGKTWVLGPHCSRRVEDSQVNRHQRFALFSRSRSFPSRVRPIPQMEENLSCLLP